MSIHLYKHDLPDGLDLGTSVAIDTETMGLNLGRDRLCLVQISSGDGQAHLVQIAAEIQPCPNLEALLADQRVEKLFHFARFDLAMLKHHIRPVNGAIFCTKIASKLCRTYTDRHSLSELCRELLGLEISKQQQSSDWGAEELTHAQQKYAAGDVLYLHKLRDKLGAMLTRLDRMAMANACFAFLSTRTDLDMAGFETLDIFHH
jgi:ribonuclease D